MNKIENLNDVFKEQSQELQNAYEQELKELPNIKQKAASPELKRIINDHIESTKTQQNRLKTALSKMQITPTARKSIITEAILKDTNSKITGSATPQVCDVCIVGSLQQLGHRKIAELGALSAYAKEIGQKEIANDLHTSFNEEKKIGKELINLAQSEINKNALSEMIA